MHTWSYGKAFLILPPQHRPPRAATVTEGEFGIAPNSSWLHPGSPFQLQRQQFPSVCSSVSPKSLPGFHHPRVHHPQGCGVPQCCHCRGDGLGPAPCAIPLGLSQIIPNSFPHKLQRDVEPRKGAHGGVALMKVKAPALFTSLRFFFGVGMKNPTPSQLLFMSTALTRNSTFKITPFCRNGVLKYTPDLLYPAPSPKCHPAA